MIRNSIQRFMYGRYGNDQLNLFLMVLYLIFYVIGIWTGFQALLWIAIALMFVALYRLCSRNLSRRREENSKFMRLCGPAIRWFRFQRTVHRDKEHCYFKCPSCGQQLRVPRGKGKITVTCRGCGASFQENS